MANPYDNAGWPEIEVAFAYPTQTSPFSGQTIQSRAVDTRVARTFRLRNPNARPIVWLDVERHAQAMQARAWPVVIPGVGPATVKYAAAPSAQPSGPQSFSVTVVLQELLASAV